MSEGVEINQKAVEVHVQRTPVSPPGDRGHERPSIRTHLRIINNHIREEAYEESRRHQLDFALGDLRIDL